MSSLNERAMLASLSIHQWSAKKFDKKVSKEVAQQHNASEDVGRYNKSLIAKSALEKIAKIAGAARTDFYELTLPWKDDGARILTSAGYLKLTERMRKHQAEFLPAVDEFISEYPDLKEQAKISLNGLYNEADYPSVSEIKTKFRFGFHVVPLPIAEDFRVKLSDVEARAIQQQITANLQESVKDAMQDVWRRMQSVVNHMATSLKEYKIVPSANTKQGFKVENGFRDSLVNNIRELLDIIPALNLTEDATVAQFAKDMQALTKYDANVLRDNDTTRENIAKQADDILKKMAAFV